MGVGVDYSQPVDYDVVAFADIRQQRLKPWSCPERILRALAFLYVAFDELALDRRGSGFDLPDLLFGRRIVVEGGSGDITVDFRLVLVHALSPMSIPRSVWAVTTDYHPAFCGW